MEFFEKQHMMASLDISVCVKFILVTIYKGFNLAVNFSYLCITEES